MNINNIKFLKRGNTKYYNKVNALKLLSAIENKKLKLFGIDGMFITETKTQPSMEHSIDFSLDPYSFIDYTDPQIYSMAKEYLERMPDELYFDVVYDKSNINNLDSMQ